ncbi:ArsR family transcriptional regulator [Haloarcula pellucida]|nr:ArsR family transcriptional regulator [Halomicroarcula pellucida]MBX0346599.1 ArsR family transcriptional regulator [Halomicroarcula pellucida]
MDPIDDRILELFREQGNLNPAAIDEFGVTSANHASRRCSVLAKYGLLHRIASGLYTITDEGIAYLDEELDASTLDPVDDA